MPGSPCARVARLPIKKRSALIYAPSVIDFGGVADGKATFAFRNAKDKRRTDHHENDKRSNCFRDRLPAISCCEQACAEKYKRKHEHRCLSQVCEAQNETQ